MPLIEQIADDERQDQIGEEIDQTRIDVIHKTLLKKIKLCVHPSTSRRCCKYFDLCGINRKNPRKVRKILMWERGKITKDGEYLPMLFSVLL